MEVFDESKQLVLEAEMDDYYAWTLDRGSDLVKRALAVPIPVPICRMAYILPGEREPRQVCVYPTLQFLYSKHIKADYISQEVRDFVYSRTSGDAFKSCFKDFFKIIDSAAESSQPISQNSSNGATNGATNSRIKVKVSEHTSEKVHIKIAE